MPLVNYIVNASTSVVQIPTVFLSTTLSSPIVLLSSLNSPGQIITVRDTDGICSLDFPIVISTTSNVHFLEGPQVSSVRITQPFGFVAVSPRTSTIWNLLNTYAFPEQYAAANLNTLNTSIIYTSSMIATGEIVMSSVTISSLNVTTFVTSASTSVNAMVVKSTLNIGDLASTNRLNAAYISTGDLDVFSTASMSSIIASGSLFFLGPMSTLESLGVSTLGVANDATIGGNLSTTSNVGIGGSLSTVGTVSVTGGVVIGGNLSTASNVFFGGSVSTIGSFDLGGILRVDEAGFFQGILSTGSSLIAADGASIANVLNASTMSTTGNVIVGKRLITSSLTTEDVTTSTLTVRTSGVFLSSLTVNSSIVGYSLVLTSNLSVDGQIFFGNAISTGSSIHVADGATIARLLNASTVSTTGNVIVGASLSASSFNTTNITASTFTITSNATVNSTLTAYAIGVGPSTIRLNASTATYGSAFTWNSYQGTAGLGNSYTEILSAKGGGGVGGFMFFTGVPDNTRAATSNLAMYINPVGQELDTIYVFGGGTFTSTLTTQTLNASGRVRASAISTTTISTGTLTAGGGTVRLAQGTAQDGLAITWNSYPAITGNGNVELLASKGGAATGGIAFYTGLTNNSAPVAGNLSLYLSQANLSDTLQVYGGLRVLGVGTFSNTATFSNAIITTATGTNFISNTTNFIGTATFSNSVGFLGATQFSGTNIPRMTYGLQIDQAPVALSVSTLANFNSTVTFGTGGTVNILNGLYLANSATQQLACANQATFTNNVTFSNSSAILINFGSNSVVNFSNATVQGLSISFPVTTL